MLCPKDHIWADFEQMVGCILTSDSSSPQRSTTHGKSTSWMPCHISEDAYNGRNNFTDLQCSLLYLECQAIWQMLICRNAWEACIALRMPHAEKVSVKGTKCQDAKWTKYRWRCHPGLMSKRGIRGYITSMNIFLLKLAEIPRSLFSRAWSEPVRCNSLERC